NRLQDSTKMKPFYLVYGREAKIWTEEGDDKEISIIDRLEHIMEKLPEERYKAKIEIEKSQGKQKQYHDKRNKRKPEFRIGEKVLYYNMAKEKQWTGKLDEKWKGPYYIHEILLKGSYRIKDITG